jgi:hypothetical protein
MIADENYLLRRDISEEASQLKDIIDIHLRKEVNDLPIMQADNITWTPLQHSIFTLVFKKVCDQIKQDTLCKI